MTTFLACIGSFVLGHVVAEWSARKVYRIAVAATTREAR